EGQSNFARPFTIAGLPVHGPVHMDRPFQVFAVPALVMERPANIQQKGVENCAEWIDLQLDVTRLPRIRLDEDFIHFLCPQMRISLSQGGPDILILIPKCEVEK